MFISFDALCNRRAFETRGGVWLFALSSSPVLVTTGKMANIPLDIERLCVEAAISDFVLDHSKQLPPVLWVCRRFKDW